MQRMLPKSSPCLVMRHTNGGLRLKLVLKVPVG